MKQFGKKTPPKRQLTLNEIAISASKRFLKTLILDSFFEGPEKNLTPHLKNTLNEQFERFITKNKKTNPAVWSLFIEHITEFSEEVFRLKRSGAKKPSWAFTMALVDRYAWKELQP